ncbi:MAG: hypothetical protein KDI36_19115 [Pseudomonadales bacterium]|nr:hypothetical protein [Pseudomonadales bacterium]
MRRFITLVCLMTITAQVFAATVEEERIGTAETAMPAVLAQASALSAAWVAKLQECGSGSQLTAVAAEAGSDLWQAARSSVQQQHTFEDRSLYWARLILTRLIRTGNFRFDPTPEQRLLAIEKLEDHSRGRADISYDSQSDFRILLTGFDPFLLDQNIQQTNPSGVIALWLDGRQLTSAGRTATINTVTFPVRYSDFDEGEVERLLIPVYRDQQADLVVTVSMGRAMFDLERFPGRRRSASAPDNLNIHAGGSETNPVIGLLNGQPMAGPEFVEFSLPAAAMQQIDGTYDIHDNHQVTTLEKTSEPDSLAELQDQIAVRGSGGGYLSNEISYRSIRLRNELGSSIPTGHIHTPRVTSHDPAQLQDIAAQVTRMLEAAMKTLSEVH